MLKICLLFGALLLSSCAQLEPSKDGLTVAKFGCDSVLVKHRKVFYRWCF